MKVTLSLLALLGVIFLQQSARAGQISVVETGSRRILRVDDMPGANIHIYANGASPYSEKYGLSALAIDAGNHLYATDIQHNRVLFLSNTKTKPSVGFGAKDQAGAS